MIAYEPVETNCLFCDGCWNNQTDHDGKTVYSFVAIPFFKLFGAVGVVYVCFRSVLVFGAVILHAILEKIHTYLAAGKNLPQLGTLPEACETECNQCTKANEPHGECDCKCLFPCFFWDTIFFEMTAIPKMQVMF
jgi:hypothetical protein